MILSEMLPLGRSELTLISRLALRGQTPDPLLARLRVTQALQRATLHPPGLPRTAILCVRHLRYPQVAEKYAENEHRRGAGQRASTWEASAWETTVQSLLARAWQDAARPAFGPTPTNAEAVLFADQSEVLACLAEAWLAGGDPTHWWWRSLLSTPDLTRGLLNAWLDAPEYVPSALEQLARKGQAQIFVAALPPTAAATLLQSVISRFGLAALQQAFAPHPAAGIPEDTPPAAPAAIVAPPWQDALPELQTVGLSRHQHALLGIALLLRRAPAALRSAAFAQAAARWWGQEAHTATRPTTPTAARTAALDAPPTAPSHALQMDVHPPSVAPPHHTPEASASRSSPDAQQPLALPPGANAPSHVQSAIDEPPIPAPPQPVAEIAMQDAAPDTGIDTPPSLPPLPFAAAQTPAGEPLPMTTIETGFGGLFYLINLGIYLELYADFTTPLAPGIALDLYDFLALVGDAWFGEALHSDPVWPLLAQLAGRGPEEPPGHNFVPPGNQFFDAWFGALLATAEARLHAALDLPPHRLLPQLLCAHQAQVTVSATHLDIHLSLAGLPIAIRLSGLDRNPGWVPAAGRYVTFYFE